MRIFFNTINFSSLQPHNNLSIIRLDNAFYLNVSLFYKTTPYVMVHEKY